MSDVQTASHVHLEVADQQNAVATLKASCHMQWELHDDLPVGAIRSVYMAMQLDSMPVHQVGARPQVPWACEGGSWYQHVLQKHATSSSTAESIMESSCIHSSELKSSQEVSAFLLMSICNTTLIVTRAVAMQWYHHAMHPSQSSIPPIRRSVLRHSRASRCVNAMQSCSHLFMDDPCVLYPFAVPKLL